MTPDTLAARTARRLAPRMVRHWARHGWTLDTVLDAIELDAGAPLTTAGRDTVAGILLDAGAPGPYTPALF